MKKILMFMLLISVLILAISPANAQSDCKLETNLINQDPLPANPGEKVEVLLQVEGVKNSGCGKVSLEIMENFPFSAAAGQDKKLSIDSGTFVRNRESSWMIPLDIMVNKDANEGNNTLEFVVSRDEEKQKVIEDFDLEVRDTQTDFEMFVREYNKKEKEITFDLINVGDNDIESLVVEIPEQESIKLSGSNKKTVGFLDSNEDTTVRFGVSEINGENIKAKIRYNDAINERREIEKDIYLNPEILESTEEEQNTPISTYLLIALVILIIAYWIYKRNKKKSSKS